MNMRLQQAAMGVSHGPACKQHTATHALEGGGIRLQVRVCGGGQPLQISEVELGRRRTCITSHSTLTTLIADLAHTPHGHESSQQQRRLGFVDAFHRR